MTAQRQPGRRVKVIATLGPASSAPEVIRALLAAGADGLRLNAAHLQPEEIGPLVAAVRQAEAERGAVVAVFCDLAGPKLRIRKGHPALDLAAGAVIRLGPADSTTALPIDGFDPGIECRPGDRVLLNDGKVALRVLEQQPDHVVATVERGGEVRGGKGVNLPDSATSLPSLTEHDRRCIAASLEAGVDALSLSFVRRPEDVVHLRREIASHGRSLPVIAKLEKAQAVSESMLVPLLYEADMVMVARGDLGAETAPERVPVLQKRILQEARAVGTPAITATEMLESMILEDRPTRAEAADIANAVYDGSDALMLTAETAIGAHPALAVATCARVALEAEAYPEYRTGWSVGRGLPEVQEPLPDAVAAAAAGAAAQLGAAAIVCFTSSGRTGRLVARHRPSAPVLVLTARPEVARAMSIVWGLIPRITPDQPEQHEEVVALAEREALASGLVHSGELIVITHGAPLGADAPTNLLRVHRLR